jgi:uncharacterized protein (TIGR03435 family)
MRNLLCATSVVLLTGILNFAQPLQAQQFDIASVKASPPGNGFGSMDGGPLPPGPFNMANHDPTRITWTKTRLIRILMMAYDLPADRISGPNWLETETYDIVATVSPGTTVPNFKLMVQNLLKERFNLAVHQETRDVSGYAVEVARGGPKLKTLPPPEPADPRTSDPAIRTPPGTFVDKSGFPAPLPDNAMFPPGTGFEATIRVNDMHRATVLNEPMSSIAKFLGAAAGMPVEDRTGLTGTYSFHLEYKPGVSNADSDMPAPDIFDAVQSQLGLKLVRGKVPRETLVIDHADKVPVEN